MSFIKVNYKYGEIILNTNTIVYIQEDSWEKDDTKRYVVRLVNGEALQFSKEQITKIFDVIGFSL